MESMWSKATIIDALSGGPSLWSQYNIAEEDYKLPEPIPKGLEITNMLCTKTWIIGEVIGSGGSATVYCAADKESPNNFDYAVKIEYKQYGEVESEIHCYREIINPVRMSNWIKEKKRSYLGLSPFYASGVFTYKSSEYIFLVMKRFGKDLQTLLEENNGTFSLKTVCLIGLSVIDILEYVHSCEYVHADIKPSHLLIGGEKETENQVYLIDFADSVYYIVCGDHVPYHLGSAGAGTPIFTSRDGHTSRLPRRSDLEVLAYNIIKWLTGRLLWEDFSQSCELLKQYKNKYMNDVDNFLTLQFQGEENVPNGISELLHYINGMEFADEPDYDRCRKIFKEMLKSAGYSDTDYTLEFK